ncbi:DUF819 family protein [Saccharicrinis sp. FJH54]|uniref:DUF819 family protein n=1 Tax=Saccharicrinis sp. FJH54 TaxID=3344665 RepID=UPI0035D401F3
MLVISITLIVFLGFPVTIDRLEKKSRIIRWLSPIIVCYLAGILLGNIPGLNLNRELLNMITGIAVFLAIPLLLFSSHFKKIIKQVKPALLAYFLGVAGLLICVFLAFTIFREEVSKPEAVSGMLVGVYTGGTPNMSAIGLSLNVEEEVFILLNSADIVFSGVYFVFLLTFGKHLLALFLPGSVKHNKTELRELSQIQQYGIKKNISYIAAGFILSVLIFMLSTGFSWLIMKDWNMDNAVPYIILGITTLGIVASFHPNIRNLPHTYKTANYLLLVFAMSMGALANFSELIANSSVLFRFCGFVVFGSVTIHLLLAYLFKLDRDTVIIASTAAIFGPAFIGPVAKSIDNDEIITIGISLGLIGYAIGNYLGIGFALLLNNSW